MHSFNAKESVANINAARLKKLIANHLQSHCKYRKAWSNLHNNAIINKCFIKQNVRVT